MTPNTKKTPAAQKTLLNFFQKTPKQSPSGNKPGNKPSAADSSHNDEETKSKGNSHTSSGSLTPPQSDLSSSPKTYCSPLARKRKIISDSDDEDVSAKRVRDTLDTSEAQWPDSSAPATDTPNHIPSELKSDPPTEPLSSSCDRLAKFGRESNHKASEPTKRKASKLPSAPKFEEE